MLIIIKLAIESAILLLFFAYCYQISDKIHEIADRIRDITSILCLLLLDMTSTSSDQIRVIKSAISPVCLV